MQICKWATYHRIGQCYSKRCLVFSGCLCHHGPLQIVIHDGLSLISNSSATNFSETLFTIFDKFSNDVLCIVHLAFQIALAVFQYNECLIFSHVVVIGFLYLVIVKSSENIILRTSLRRELVQLKICCNLKFLFSLVNVFKAFNLI